MFKNTNVIARSEATKFATKSGIIRPDESRRNFGGQSHVRRLPRPPYGFLTMTEPVSYYLDLTKPRLLSMVLLSTAIGFYLRPEAHFNFYSFFICMIATAFVGAGAMVLNQYMERESDSKMVRTMNRALPSGNVTPRHAFIFGISLTFFGLLLFAFFTNALAFIFALATSLSYLLVYTPLKKITSLATFAGAIPGALPPLIGWAAARGNFNAQAVVLFLILFFWQMPHFLSINWMYREDYERGGFPTLAVRDPEGKVLGHQMIVNMSALLCVSLLPTIYGITGTIYFFGAFALGLSFAGIILYSLSDLNERARFVLRGSIAYLAFLFILMAIDKI